MNLMIYLLPHDWNEYVLLEVQNIVTKYKYEFDTPFLHCWTGEML